MKPFREPKDEFGRRHVKTDNGGMVQVAVPMREASGVPCVECPFRKDGAPGFLGGYSPEMYMEIIRSPASIACHRSAGFKTGEIEKQHHCTGAAAFRAHLGWIAQMNGRLAVAHDSTKKVGSLDSVFTTEEEFVSHHSKGQIRLSVGRREIYSGEMNGRIRHFDVTAMNEDARKNKFGQPFTTSMAGMMEANSKVEVDEAKLVRWIKQMVEGHEPALKAAMQPVLVFMEDGKGWLVDGHHRMNIVNFFKMDSIRCFIIEDVSPYELQGEDLARFGMKQGD